MQLVAGVDIGNSTTEVALAEIEGSRIEFIASGIHPTTGIKGTKENINGILSALDDALRKSQYEFSDIASIQINEASPVIGDVAMETITETIITESTMIGHNPSTPGGVGLGLGKTMAFSDVEHYQGDEEIIVCIPRDIDFAVAAQILNQKLASGVKVRGAIAQNNDGVLICNRLQKTLPIIDEVAHLEKVPLGMQAAVEVAAPGKSIETLSNPYGIATVFSLNPEETKLIVPVARALIGNRSAVVIRTPQGDVHERRIPAGKLIILGERHKAEVDVELGAAEIMDSVEKIKPLQDAQGEPGTNVGGMLQRVKKVMANLTDQNPDSVAIQDILAVDTFVPQAVKGGVAGESALESAVGIAAMVKTNRLPMQQIAAALQDRVGIKVEIAGIEANMAILGALTTPGTNKPLAILDMGAGSTDAAIITAKNVIYSTHLAGAGDMVTMLINSELGLENSELAEEIKTYPLAKVESMFHIRREDGTVQFFDQPLDPRLFARVVILKGNGADDLTPIPTDYSMERIRMVRQESKRKVFVTNALRALGRVATDGNIRLVDFVVMVGGSALDFEIPEMLTEALAEYKVVAGRANIRGVEGPRNAVATGLVFSYFYRNGGGDK
ncbi:MAG TPA: diol dehydratase reactivase subunit alpha [Firmicutes bacterium]|jgi:diol dehydratase reactivase alpha subunit|nr:diol dehydratase reactivase subunit alpha [Bacillota bacterium]